MLEIAGFDEAQQTDCTEEFAAVARACIDRWDRNRTELTTLFGEQAFSDRQADRRAQLRAGEDGVLRRAISTARMAA